MAKCFIKAVTTLWDKERITYFVEDLREGEDPKAALKRVQKLGRKHPAIAAISDPDLWSLRFYLVKQQPSKAELRKSLAYAHQGAVVLEKKIANTQKLLDELWARLEQQEEFCTQQASDKDFSAAQRSSNSELEEVTL